MRTNAILILVAALALGGCDMTTSGGLDGPGVLAGAFAGSGTDPAFGALIGSKIGSALDENDRRMAYQAQIDALERGAPGAPIAWRNPDTGRHGNIVAGPPYELKGEMCRGYSHTVTIGAQLETVRKTACRTGDGKWIAVS
jgi:surface antigen